MKAFFDTNLVVYANDKRDPRKQRRAVELITQAIEEHNGVVSTQVLQEYVVAAIAKLGQNEEFVLRQLMLLETLEVVQITPAIVRRSLEIASRYHINYWDACILASAEHANCEVLWSEDLNPGQLYAGVRLVNPFE